MSNENNVLKVRTGIVIIYSLIIIASTAPVFRSDISNSIEIVYYLLVPGYLLTLYLGEEYAILERVLLSFALGLMVVMVLYSYNQTFPFTLPFELVIPIGSIGLVVFDYYRRRIRFV